MCTCRLTRPPLTLAACGTPSSGETFPTATAFVLTTQVQCCRYPEQSSCEHAANVRSNALPSCLPSFSLYLLTEHCHQEITGGSCTGWCWEPDS